MSIDIHWRTVEKKYEDGLMRFISYHQRALDSIKEIHDEEYFEKIDGTKYKRTNEEKMIEISELIKRFVLPETTIKTYKHNIKYKLWRAKNDETFKATLKY